MSGLTIGRSAIGIKVAIGPTYLGDHVSWTRTAAGMGACCPHARSMRVIVW